MGKLADFAQRMKDQFSVYRAAIRHPETPRLARWLMLAGVAYALSPIDLIPDFIPGIGYLDDVVIVPLLIYLGWRLVPERVKQECREQAGRRRGRRGAK